MEHFSKYLRSIPNANELKKLSKDDLAKELKTADPSYLADAIPVDSNYHKNLEDAELHYSLAMNSLEEGRPIEAITHMEHVRHALRPMPKSVSNMVMLRQAAKIAFDLTPVDQERFMMIVTGDPDAMKVIKIDDEIAADPYEIYASASAAEKRHAEGIVFDPHLFAPHDPMLIGDALKDISKLPEVGNAVNAFSNALKKYDFSTTNQSNEIQPFIHKNYKSYSTTGSSRNSAYENKKKALKKAQREIKLDTLRVKHDLIKDTKESALKAVQDEMMQRVSAVTPMQFKGMTIRELVLMNPQQWENTIDGLDSSMKKRLPAIEQYRARFRPEFKERGVKDIYWDSLLKKAVQLQ